MVFSAAVLCCLIPVLQTAAIGQTPTKASLTPMFWQRDPDADFEDEGRQHCAPVSVSDGLIYLAKAYGMKNLVPGTGKRDQIKLIQELAEEFGTDPSIGGTNPDKILTGMQTYTEAKGYELKRLELKSWRGVSSANKEFKVGTKPDLEWIKNAVQARDNVVVFNFGWYRETDDSYERKGGHWVAVVGVNGNDFVIHNPILKPEDQGCRRGEHEGILRRRRAGPAAFGQRYSDTRFSHSFQHQTASGG